MFLGHFKVDSRWEERPVAALRRLLGTQTEGNNAPPPREQVQGGNVKELVVTAQRRLSLGTAESPICIGSDDELTVELPVTKEVKGETESLVSEVKSGKKDAISDVRCFRIPLSFDSQGRFLILHG